MSAWELLKSHWEQPEYLHVLLNPLSLWGTFLGLIGLLLAQALRSRPAQIVALSLLFIGAISAWPVVELGQGAYDRVLSMSDTTGAAWLHEHMDRAEDLLWVFIATAVLALATLFLPIKWPRSARPLLVLTIIGTLASLGCGAWIGYAGGQVRHKEFRYGTPPPVPPEEEEHHHH